MKKLIPILIVTHILCILLGYFLGIQHPTPEEYTETILPTDTIQEVTAETTKVEIADTTVCTEEVVEESTEATESTEIEDIPIYAPAVTTPSSTEPSETNPTATTPPATQPPATEPPVTQPPATEPPVQRPDDMTDLG